MTIERIELKTVKERQFRYFGPIIEKEKENVIKIKGTYSEQIQFPYEDKHCVTVVDGNTIQLDDEKFVGQEINDSQKLMGMLDMSKVHVRFVWSLERGR